MHVAYVNVFVSDLAKAVAFYRDTLGLTLEFASDAHGYASFAAGPVRLGLALPGSRPPTLVGRHTGVGLQVDDLEAEHARLTGLGVRFALPPTRQPWGGFMALIADPDGNVFYLDQVEAAHGEPPGERAGAAADRPDAAVASPLQPPRPPGDDADGSPMQPGPRPPDEQANAGLWILSVTATAVNLGFWQAASAWNGAENYAGLAWLLFGLPLLFVQVVVATPWLVSRLRRGIGASRPRQEVRAAIAIPVLTVAAMIAIALVHD